MVSGYRNVLLTRERLQNAQEARHPASSIIAKGAPIRAFPAANAGAQIVEPLSIPTGTQRRVSQYDLPRLPRHGAQS